MINLRASNRFFSKKGHSEIWCDKICFPSPQTRCQVSAHAYETNISVVYMRMPNMTVVGGNNYKQCNFEDISACRRNFKENSSAAILNRLSVISNRNRNLKTSKALLKSQAHQGTSLFTSESNGGFPKGGQEKLRSDFQSELNLQLGVGPIVRCHWWCNA